jgi:hypothetical protein
MTVDDRLERHLSDGLDDLAGSGSPTYLDDVLRRTAHTRQRPAWLPLKWSAVPAGAPRERAGGPTGRLARMTSLIPYAAIGSLGLAAAVALFPLAGSSPANVAEPSPGPSSSSAPRSLDMAPAWVTGTASVVGTTCGAPTTTSSGEGVASEWGLRCTGQSWEMNDPRLTGTAAVEWSQDIYDVADGERMAILVERYDLQNDLGSWVCRSDAVFAPYSGTLSSASDAETILCRGDGGYEGLTAILIGDWTTLPAPMRGAIFPGEPPPMPGEEPVASPEVAPSPGAG